MPSASVARKGPRKSVNVGALCTSGSVIVPTKGSSETVTSRTMKSSLTVSSRIRCDRSSRSIRTDGGSAMRGTASGSEAVAGVSPSLDGFSVIALARVDGNPHSIRRSARCPSAPPLIVHSRSGRFLAPVFRRKMPPRDAGRRPGPLVGRPVNLVRA